MDVLYVSTDGCADDGIVPLPCEVMRANSGHQNIQLTVKLYGHPQPGANRHWMNKLNQRAEAFESRSKA
jgi:hypothetical protein